MNQLLIKEADINNNSKDVKYYSTLKNNLKSMGIEATDNSLLVDVDLYRYYCKSMIKLIIISNTDVNDNINLTTIIPNIHHQRLVKVSITTLLNTYIFYTVNAFSNYTFEVLENELNKLDLIDLVKQ